MAPNEFLPSRRALAVKSCAAALFSLLVAAAPASAVVVTIKTTDNPGEGFNDPSARVPVGGNPGTTLGAQRLFLFQKAAEMWGEVLGGNIPIIVTAKFTPQGGTSVSATLGFARPTTVHRDFAGAVSSQTWYVAAEANELSGTDRNDISPGACPVPLTDGKCPEIETEFNSDVDGPVVLGLVDFYYGLDGITGIDLDFLSVLLHEIGHGLGVLHLVDGDLGSTFFGFIDAYSARLEDATITPHSFAAMADNQRVLAMRDDGDLVFKGPAMVEATDALSAGVRNDGAVKVFAPADYLEGSSVAHVDVSASPDELMEPFLTQPAPHSLDLTTALLSDIGWPLAAVQTLCGDFNGDMNITTSDALGILRVSVGIGSCLLSICDVNSSGLVTTGDAQATLRKAVGQNVTMNCPA